MTVQLALTIAATICAAITIPITLMLAPRGGLSAGTAASLVAVGSTSVERRLSRMTLVCGVLSAALCLAVAICGALGVQ